MCALWTTLLSHCSTPLSRCIPPPLIPPAQVETYMARVVDKMRSELRGILAASVRAYPAKPREQWLFDWPSQTILVSVGLGVMVCGATAAEDDG